MDFQVQNGQPLSAAPWQIDLLPSSQQLMACRALFSQEATPLALAAVDLNRVSGPAPVEGGPRADLTGHDLAATYLTPCERERWAAFTFAKRRGEWLGGRLAAKLAAMALLAGSPQPPLTAQALSIETEASGRPFLEGQPDRPGLLPEISISHSGNLAGALAVSGHSCGLDLQKITPKAITVRDRFASPAERALLRAALPALNEETALTLLWSAKEALRKAIPCQPLAGFTELTLRHLEGKLPQGLIGHFSCPRLPTTLLPVFLFLYSNYACALTVSGPQVERLPGRGEETAVTL